MIERPSLMDRRNLNDNRMHSALYWLVMAGEALDAETRKRLWQSAVREAKLGQIQRATDRPQKGIAQQRKDEPTWQKARQHRA